MLEMKLYSLFFQSSPRIKLYQWYYYKSTFTLTFSLHLYVIFHLLHSCAFMYKNFAFCIYSVVKTVGSWSTPRDSMCCSFIYIAQITSEIKLNDRLCLPKNLRFYTDKTFLSKTQEFFFFQMLPLMFEREARINRHYVYFTGKSKLNTLTLLISGSVIQIHSCSLHKIRWLNTHIALYTVYLATFAKTYNRVG